MNITPTFSSQPSYELSSKHKKLNAFLHERVLSVSIADHLDTYIDELTLSFDNRSFKDLFIPPPDFGKHLSLKLGYPPMLTNMGSFYIDSWNVSTPPSKINITAKSINLLQGFFDQKTEVWQGSGEEKKTIAQVIKTIAKNYKLMPKISESYEKKTIEEYQYVESDINFISRLAKQYNAYFKIKQNKLFFKEYSLIKNISFILLNNNNLLSYQVEQQEADNYTSVHANWYDYENASIHLEIYNLFATLIESENNLLNNAQSSFFVFCKKNKLSTIEKLTLFLCYQKNNFFS
ncbi:MAG: contractile injection system protein, VgrG/Pvc8 family [Rickettsia endosymbiont of Ixodes persulcatus]|nr:contractile injection system protein, VgrG/Pvc8 family [Rickettsia endosymbiont of Ixodes persulcatus]